VTRVQLCIPVELSSGWTGYVITLDCGHWLKSETRIEPYTSVWCQRRCGNE
jgi:hypothetical protein